MIFKNGIQDIRLVIEESVDKGKWQSWFDNYYMKYKQIFDEQLENCYMSDINLFKKLVEEMNFEDVLAKLEWIENESYVYEVEKLINNAAKALDYNKEFEVYLLYGFGHVSGTAGKHELPFVYYGVENLHYDTMRYLIPHEINHMIRNDILEIHKEFKSIQDMRIIDVIINEGLGVVFPLTLMGDMNEIDESQLRKSIGVREEQFSRLLINENKFMQKMLEMLDKKLTGQLWYDYFVINNSSAEITSAIGYFIGGRIIQSLISNGIEISKLTKLPSEDVVKMYVNKRHIT